MNGSSNKVIVISVEEFLNILNPLFQRLDHFESLLSQKFSIVNSTYSDAEAAKYLNMSTKKLQHLRNARKIGFIREDGGRKITYKHEHLLEYLASNELKKKK
jgi:predicted subunit of tRNA(5-methylaminomethyl-2-thiouridylate) methyltransferase